MKQKEFEMGRAGMVMSAIAIAIGAVMYWALTSGQGHGFRVSTVGVILMIVGAVGFVVSAIVFASSRSTVSNNRTYDRQATNEEGQTTAVHEEVR